MKQLIRLSPRRSRGRIVLAAIAFALLAGVGTNALSVTSWASGVSAGEQAQMSAENAASYPLAFDAAIETSVTGLQSTGSGEAASAFYASYVTATQDYGTALLSAADIYTATYPDNPAAARDTYIDNFSRARAAYFGQLETARNRLVSETTGNDVARNMFVNEYNAARDTYNNQLETVKNQIATLQV